MAKLFFAGSFLFALAAPLGAQSVTLNVCNAGKADVDVFAARGNPAVVAHIVPNTCADVYSETTGVPASVGFVLTDTRGQWGAPRRLDLIPDVGNAFAGNAWARAAGNVTVRRGNQNVTAQAQLSFRPAIPKCGTYQLGQTTSNVDRLPLNASSRQVTQAVSADAAAGPRGSVTVCDYFVYRLNAVAYPDTREVSFENVCANCPPGDAVNIPISDAAAEQGMRELLATGRSAIPTTALLDRLKIQLPRPEARPVTWPVLLPALASTGRVSGPLPSWIPQYVVLRGTVSRVEVSPPGASAQWVNVSFREAPDTPDSTGKLHAELNVCASDPEIFQDVFGADFRTSMIGKAIEVEGEIQRSYCQGLKGNVRVTLAHQVRVVKSALFDAATLAAAPVIVPASDVQVRTALSQTQLIHMTLLEPVTSPVRTSAAAMAEGLGNVRARLENPLLGTANGGTERADLFPAGIELSVAVRLHTADSTAVNSILDLQIMSARLGGQNIQLISSSVGHRFDGWPAPGTVLIPANTPLSFLVACSCGVSMSIADFEASATRVRASANRPAPSYGSRPILMGSMMPITLQEAIDVASVGTGKLFRAQLNADMTFLPNTPNVDAIKFLRGTEVYLKATERIPGQAAISVDHAVFNGRNIPVLTVPLLENYSMAPANARGRQAAPRVLWAVGTTKGFQVSEQQEVPDSGSGQVLVIGSSVNAATTGAGASVTPQPAQPAAVAPPARTVPPPAAAPRGTPASPVNLQQQVEERRQQAQRFAACQQKAIADHPQGSADFAKAMTACAQTK